MLEMGAQDLEVTARDRGRNGVSSSLDSIGYQFMSRVVEGIYSLHKNPVSPCALDTRAHCYQTLRQVADFGITRCVQDFAFTPCESRGHQGRFSRPNGWRRKYDTATAQPIAL